MCSILGYSSRPHPNPLCHLCSQTPAHLVTRTARVLPRLGPCSAIRTPTPPAPRPTCVRAQLTCHLLGKALPGASLAQGPVCSPDDPESAGFPGKSGLTLAGSSSVTWSRRDSKHKSEQCGRVVTGHLGAGGNALGPPEELRTHPGPGDGERSRAIESAGRGCRVGSHAGCRGHCWACT